MTAPLVFLLDVDNTLLDNDLIILQFKYFLLEEFGPQRHDRYWAIFENIRTELGYADYLGALQRYRAENPRDPHFLETSFYLLDYPFAERLYPKALEVVAKLSEHGPTVIVSDGDAVFQPRKVKRSGLFDAVEKRALIYIHKEQELDDIEQHYPAQHYVLIDDKLRILTAIKKSWGARVTTVFVRQGHYALDTLAQANYPPADFTIEHIADMLDFDLARLPSVKK